MASVLDERISNQSKGARAFIVRSSLMTEDRLKVLGECAIHCRDIEGEFWECGVYMGGSAGLIGQIGDHKVLRLFDSFQGVSEPQPEDTPIVIDKNEPPMWAGEWRGDMRRAALNIGRDAIFHVGWIPERFKDVPPEAKVAFAHLDLDLYQPTKDSLEFILPRLSPGGLIVIDDFDITRNPGIRTAIESVLPKWPNLRGEQRAYGQVVLYMDNSNGQ